MNLKDTVALMCSDSYKDRLKAEYWQVRNRYDKLVRVLTSASQRALNIPEDQQELMQKQAHYMYHYMITLSERCKLEGINLND